MAQREPFRRTHGIGRGGEGIDGTPVTLEEVGRRPFGPSFEAAVPRSTLHTPTEERAATAVVRRSVKAK